MPSPRLPFLTRRSPRVLQITIKVLQDREGRVYRRGDLEFVETRWIYHEIHRCRFPAPALFGQKGTMWKVEEFHFARGAYLAWRCGSGANKSRVCTCV